ncbi:MAG: serine hydrolase domain-containing protein [Planctomycetota bacterium]
MGFFKKSRSRRIKRHRVSQRRRGFEQLEDRRVMAVVTGASTFDPQLMGDNIEWMSDGNTVGYGYAINSGNVVNAAVGGSGQRRTAADSPERDFYSTTELEISSVSKTVTATAVLHFLQSQPGGLDAQLDTLLNDYLPSDWNPGANTQNVTLRHLLTHRSGFLEVNNPIGVDFNSYSNNNFANLKSLVEAGLPAPTIASDDIFDTPSWGNSYNNANFSLLAKVVLPKLMSPSLDLTTGFILGRDAFSGFLYKSYVRTNIFEPIGINDADMDTTQVNPAIGYNIADGGANSGRDQWDLSDTGGAFGWKLTARELATFLDAIEHDNSVLSFSTRAIRDEQELGWFDATTAFGTSYSHNGSTSSGSGNFRSRIVSFPGNVQASYLMNSEDNNLPGGRTGMLNTAYVNAWTDLTVNGTSGDDNFVLRLNNSGLQPSVEVVLNGNVEFTHWISTLDSVTINGSFGDDSFTIEGWNAGIDLQINGGWGNDNVSVLNSIGNIEMVNGMNFNGGLGNDLIRVYDQSNPYSHLNLSRLYTITETGVSRYRAHPAQPWNPAWFLPVGITYSNVESGTIRTGSQSDIVNVESAFSGVMNVVAGLGDDVINLGASLGDLSEFDNTYAVGGEGTDTVRIYDHNMTGGALATYHYDINEYSVSRYKTDFGGFNNGEDPITYRANFSEAENLELTTSQIKDNIRVHNTLIGQTTVHGHTGDDRLYASPDDQNMEMVDDLIFNGEAGLDKLIISDQNNPYGFGLSDDYDVSASRVIRGEAFIFLAGSPANINVDYSSVEDLTLATGNQGDTVNVESTPWTRALIQTGDGDDVVNASPTDKNMELVDGLEVDGGLGNDEFHLFDQNNPYELPGGGLYTVTPSHIGRYEEHVLLNDVAVPIDVEYGNVESVSLATGSMGDQFNVEGGAAVGTLSLDGNFGADEFNVDGPAFEQINIAGDFPWFAPGDQLNVNADGFYATAVVPGVYPAGSGEVTIDATTVSYSGIEEMNLQEQLYGGPGDFDEDGDVDGIDLTHEIAGWHQRYGGNLSGKDFLIWQRHYGNGLPRQSLELVATLSGNTEEPAEPMVLNLTDTEDRSDELVLRDDQSHPYADFGAADSSDPLANASLAAAASNEFAEYESPSNDEDAEAKDAVFAEWGVAIM